MIGYMGRFGVERDEVARDHGIRESWPLSARINVTTRGFDSIVQK